MIWVYAFTSVFLGGIFATLLLLLYPGVLKVFKPILCGPGEEMTVRKATYSFHQYGQTALEVYKSGPNGTKAINGQALALYFLFCLLICIPPAIILSNWLWPVLQELDRQY